MPPKRPEDPTKQRKKRSQEGCPEEGSKTAAEFWKPSNNGERHREELPGYQLLWEGGVNGNGKKGRRDRAESLEVRRSGMRVGR